MNQSTERREPFVGNTGPCVKTGARIWIQSHDAIANGDLYLVGSVYLYVHIGIEFWNHGFTPHERFEAYAWFNNRELEFTQHLHPVPMEHWFANQNIIALHSDYVEINK